MPGPSSRGNVPGRLMVGRLALDEVIGVQIPAGQQPYEKSTYRY